ncbi:MAG TPA: SCO family protein, partial [Acetobacteraceae bacterium]|nr:SCO family protein [Acetobacteraceae bacterium]
MPYAARAILAAVISVAPLVAGPAAVAVNATQGENLGGPFTLVDQDGRQVTDATWRGKWLLLYFGYTHCPDICPMALSNIAEALDHLGSGVRARLQPIFITVDPARDSPEVLRDYVKAFEGADIVGLSGTDA